MNTSLFRAQVTQAQQASWLGGIHLAHNPRFSLIAAVALTLAGAFLAFGAWGTVARKVRVPGILMPHTGTLELTTAMAGALLEQRVQEGEWVQQGQVLFVINTDKTSALGSTSALLASHLTQRRSTLLAERSSRLVQHQARETHLTNRIRSLALETTQATQEQALASRRAGLADKTWRKYEQMATEGFVSDIQAQNKQEELIDLQSRLEATQRNGVALSREHQAAQAELRNHHQQLSIDLLQLDRSVATLDQEIAENKSRQTSSVLAPQAGQVSTLHLPLGAMVQAGQTIASLVPHTNTNLSLNKDNSQFSVHSYAPLMAALFAPTRTAGFIQPGQEVWLRLAAYPYQKFGLAKGHVVKVSGTPIAAQDLPHGQATALLASTQSNEPLYRVQVALTSQYVVAFGTPHLLRPGMTLEADVIHDVRGIWEWIFEPLLAIHARQKTS